MCINKLYLAGDKVLKRGWRIRMTMGLTEMGSEDMSYIKLV
jgi:hypothetical protein